MKLIGAALPGSAGKKSSDWPSRFFRLLLSGCGNLFRGRVEEAGGLLYIIPGGISPFCLLLLAKTTRHLGCVNLHVLMVE